MLDQVVIGASVTMTPAEAYEAAGKGAGKVRLVTCTDGRVIGGVGSVGLILHTGETDLEACVNEVKAKLLKLAALAGQPDQSSRANLYTFIRI